MLSTAAIVCGSMTSCLQMVVRDKWERCQISSFISNNVTNNNNHGHSLSYFKACDVTDVLVITAKRIAIFDEMPTFDTV